MSAQLDQILAEFEIQPSAYPALVEDIHRQMTAGLAGEDSSLKMIPSYADAATGRECGRYLALDFGGTNLRIVMARLEDGRIQERIQSANNRLNEKTPTGEALFRQVAEYLGKFLREHNLLPAPGEPALPLGFTFSFPVQQTSIASGTLIHWTKEFIADRVEGHDVVELLTTALRQCGLEHAVRVVAIVNDTVGTMAAHSFEHPETAMGVIMGTGTNACYRERINLIPKLRNPPPGKSHTIINMEWGNYDHMPATRFDEALFSSTGHGGKMRFEKMTSGRYMGLLVRDIIRKLIADRVILHALPQGSDWVFDKENKFDAFYLDKMMADPAPYAQVRKILLQFAGRPEDDAVDFPLEHLSFLSALSAVILRRSAKLAGLMVAAVVARCWEQGGRPARMAVAVDGSVFHKSPGYDRTMQEVVDQVLGTLHVTAQVPVQHVEDGSGLGAAVIAATASN